MNITELDQYRLSDAVKFNDTLNPRLWDANEKMRPEVRQALLRIAEDFGEFLGVTDLQLRDITVSGSNAAYTYTPHSDIDLHLVVDLPEADLSEVYRELFDAKKYQYNDTHNITIGGYDVELYVENANEPPVSQGIYSVLRDQWVDVPRRKRAQIDDVSVKNKYKDLVHRIESAIKSGNLDTLTKLSGKIKEMRKAGLDQHGEFGPENLAFKVLRTQGWIDRLRTARSQAQDREMSLDERRSKKRSRVKYGWGGFGGYWYPGTAYAGQDQPAGTEGTESVKEAIDPESGPRLRVSLEQIINEFVAAIKQELDIQRLPTIKLRRDPEWTRRNGSFGRYDPDANVLYVATAGRHVLDVLRTLAHELTHRRQAEIEDIPDWGGETGSRFEDEANAMAGRIMRHLADRHPEYFADIELTENASGYIPKNKKEAALPQYAMALSVDIKPGQTGVEANKLGLKTGPNGEPGLLMKAGNQIQESRQPARNNPDLNDPPGPEFKPTMPAGTVRVDVSDMYDWYKLGQHISNMKGLGRHDFGAGPPSTIFSFGSEDLEHQYIDALKNTGLTTTDIDPADPHQPPGMPPQKVDPTYNVAEGSMKDLDIDLQDQQWDAIVGYVINGLKKNMDIGQMELNLYKYAGQELFDVDQALEDRGFRDIAALADHIQQHHGRYVPPTDFGLRDLDKGVAEGTETKKTFEIVYFSPKTDRNVTKTVKADSESAVWDQLKLKGIDVVSVKQKGVAEDDLIESLRQEFALLEDELLGEIKMSPSNLRAEAARTGALAGMEFEMIVPGVKNDDAEMEPDYDQDQRCRSIDDAVEFFNDGDFNGRREVERLRAQMEEDFSQWLMEKIDEDWDRDSEEHIYQYLITNVDPETIGEIIGQDLSDADGVTKQQAAVAAGIVNDNEQQPYYDDARDFHRDENNEAWDESDWLDAEDLDRMSGVESRYTISWPYWNYGSGEMAADIDTVAQDFSEAIGMPVNASTQYHGGRREAGHYVVEPDGSLSPDSDDDTGLEFVSPPMPIDQMLDQLKKVREWAGRYGCYTNSSTGLHINVSVPEFDRAKLDYVKLALLLGDQYVLDQFGRSSNTYAKSALGKVQAMVRDNPDKAQALLDRMRGHMDDFATQAIHSGQTDKYTSINTKNGYIEFRSPGGDWLDENFDKVENTLLRFTVALSAAMNPEAYREEYLKKLYKLLEPAAKETKNPDTVRYFSDYVAGKIPRAALRSFVKQAQLQRKIAKEPASGKQYWWRVYKDGRDARNTAMVEVVASSEQEARDKAAAEFGIFSSEYKAYMDAVALRPYVETEPEYEIFQVAGNRVVQTFRAADNNAALAYFDRTISAADRPYYDVRRAGTGPVRAQIGEPRPAGGWQLEPSQTDIENRLGLPDQTGDANYEVVNRNTMQPVFLFIANTDADASRKYSDWLAASGLPNDTEDYGFRERARPGSTLDLQRTRARQTSDQQQGGLVDVATDAGQNANQNRQFTGVWLILDPDGNVIHSFAGVGNVQSDANRVAIQWLRQNPGSMQAGVTVVPEMI